MPSQSGDFPKRAVSYAVLGLAALLLREAMLHCASIGSAAWVLPQVLTPVDWNEPLLQCTTDHTSVAHIESQDVMHGAECTKV
jgi:hypothetical protein